MLIGFYPRAILIKLMCIQLYKKHIALSCGLQKTKRLGQWVLPRQASSKKKIELKFLQNKILEVTSIIYFN